MTARRSTTPARIAPSRGRCKSEIEPLRPVVPGKGTFKRGRRHALQLVRKDVKRAGAFRPRPARVPATGEGCSPLHSSRQRSRLAISFDLAMRWSLHLSLKLMASPRELYDAMQPTFSQITSKPPFDIRLME